MEQDQQIKIYTWKYDNGAYGYAVRQIGERKVWLEQKDYGTKREVRQCLKKYKQSGKYETVKCKKVNIPGGLDCIKFRYKELCKEYDDANGFEAMNQLLNSCGSTPDDKREMLRLVASILAGYCVRQVAGSYMRYLPPLQRRVPLVAVRQAPFADVILWKMMQSLALNATESSADYFRYITSGKTVKCKYTRVLPPDANAEATTDSAYSRFQGTKERMLPQYRDTAIMVYDWILRGKACRRIQLMNRWVCLVIYGAPRKKFLATPVEIDGYQLAKSNGMWDEKAVRISVLRYANYIRQGSRRKKWDKNIGNEFARYDAIMDSYNKISRVKINTMERYHISMQLLALHLFLKSCMKEYDLDKNEAAKIEQEWYGILLPGIKISGNMDLPEETPEQDEHIQKRIESILTKMIDQGFPDKFYMGKGRVKAGRWGDFREAPKRKAPKDSLGFRISVKRLKLLFNQFDDGHEGGEWLYEHAIELGLDYMPEIKKMRIKAEEDGENCCNKNNSVEGVYFPLKEMTFLPQNLLKLIEQSCNSSCEK